MNDTTESALRLLLVEDNAGDRVLVEEQLAPETGETRYDIVGRELLGDALEALAGGAFDAVLLDLRLPDSDGLETLEAVRDAAPTVPIIVLTGLDDEDLGLKAVNSGAQDYLPKDACRGPLLRRTVRFAIERQRSVLEREASWKRELDELVAMSRPPRASATAAAYGMRPLHEAAPELFRDLCSQYMALLDLALEQQVFKVEHDVSEALRSIADRLGFANAGPRDVVVMHTRSLERRCKGVPWPKVKAYTEEGRLMVLELMGYLVDHYRNRGPQQRSTHDAAGA